MAKGLRCFPGWLSRTVCLPPFEYQAGDDRATGEFTPDPELLEQVEFFTGVRFEVFAFQAYRNGSGTDWHQDSPFDAQAILSLGVTRTFGVRRLGGRALWYEVAHGDLVTMSPGFQETHQHRVLPDESTGERVALVFRTVKR